MVILGEVRGGSSTSTSFPSTNGHEGDRPQRAKASSENVVGSISIGTWIPQVNTPQWVQTICRSNRKLPPPPQTGPSHIIGPDGGVIRLEEGRYRVIDEGWGSMEQHR